MSQKRYRSLLGFIRRLVLVTLVPAVAAAGELHSPHATARLDDVVVAAQPDVTIIHLKTSGRPKYQAELIDSPPRVVVDLEDTVFAWRAARFDAGAPLLRQVRGSQFKKGVARVVVELTGTTSYVVKQEGESIVIILGTRAPRSAPVTALAVEAAPVAAQATMETPKPIVVAQAPPTTTPAAPSGRLISLDFKDADVVNLLRILAAESGKNVIIAEDVKGKMTITLKNVPWEQALDIIMEARSLVMVERGNVIRIVTREQLARERDAMSRLEEARVKAEEAKAKADAEIRQKVAEAAVKEQEAQQRKLALEQQIEEIRARGPIKEETIRLAYADPDDVARTLLGILGITQGQQLQQVPPPAGLPSGMTAIPGIGGTPASEGTRTQPAAPQVSADAAAKGITIQAHKPTNSIFIRHYEKDIERIKKIIRETLDVQLPLIKIEGRVAEISRDLSFEVGVQWGGAGARRETQNILVAQGIATPQTSGIGILPFATPPAQFPTNPNVTLGSLLPVSGTTGLPAGGNLVNLPATGPVGGINFGIIGTRFNLNLALTALESDAKIRTFHRPELVMTDNTKGTITVGREIPYLTGSAQSGFSVAFKDAAVKLEVTPTVIREPDVTKIKMKLNIEDNSQGPNVQSGTGSTIPSIIKRTAQTEVVVKEGETLVIGGVNQRTESETITKVPLFGDIPIFGWLFKRRTTSVTPNTELAVFVTPTVLRDAPRGAAPTTPVPR
jgi:type IV pilus assembly protein PilQ